MRVIGGSRKGKTLKAPAGNDTRPTSDKVREALFDILSDSFVESDFLDIFAGAGAVGIEALSRGAARAVFIEHSRPAASIIRKNLESCEMADRSSVIVADYRGALRSLSRGDYEFGCVFADPPYAFDDHAGLFDAIMSSGLVRPDASLVLEVSAKKTLADSFAGVVKTKTRRYGDSCLCFFRIG